MPLTQEQYKQFVSTQNQKVQQSGQPQQNAAMPAPQNSSEWDYKKSPVNQKGESLPSGAESWTPFGQPYFGGGIAGTVKKYAWTLMGSPTQGPENDRWGKFLELTQSPEFWSDPFSKDVGEAAKTLGAGMLGTNPEQAKTDWKAVQAANARIKQLTDQYGKDVDLKLSKNAPAEAQAEYQELQKTVSGKAISAAENVSLLSPLVKGSKVAMQALMDVLSEAAVKLEQGQGVTSAMRDYAQENSDLPALAANIDRSKATDAQTGTKEFWDNPAVALKSEAAQNVGNITSRLLLPVLNGWDALRFWTAPGTIKEKQKVLQEGFDAGRILYSQAIKPSLLEEFKRRAAAGEDPQLLAMELQNPWAEAVGQAILDPLNFIGAGAKAAKTAGMLDDATEAVRGGELGAAAAELLGDAGKIPLGETAAAERLGKFDEVVTKNVDRIEQARLTPNYNSLTAYSPSGMRVRETKVVQSTSAIVTSSIMRNGGAADDVADFFHYLSRAVSSDKAVRLESWDAIMTLSNRFGLGKFPFSDDVLETGILLRNLTEDKDLLTALKAGRGDLAETAKLLDNTFKRAVEKQIPTYTEVKKAAEAFKTGADVTPRAEKLATTYEGIKNKALWNLHEGKLGTFKQQVNSFLGKFFFAQPGFVSRNASNNFITMFVDQGFAGTTKSFYRDGKYWSIADIDDDLMKYFGGKLPPATGGITLSKSENAGSVVTKLNDAVEGGFAKRIYWKNFRDTMDKFMTPGVALPKREEFKALGMTDDAIDHFVHVLKNETHGNMEQAIVKYSEKFGENGLLDVWKRWNGSVSADEMKGLTEIGITKQLDEISNTAKTPQEIKERIAKLKQELATRASSATDNPIGVNRERKGFEFTEGISKATEQGLMDVDGTNKLNILIEQSEKTSDELMQAIGKARDTVQDPALRSQFSVMEEAFSAERRNATRQASQQLTETAWSLTKRARKSTGLQVEQLWNESVLAKTGPAPAGLNSQQFLDELWKATRNQVSNHWETYFSEGFDRLSPLIDNLTEQYPELAGIFTKSQKASSELNMYRTAIYRDGKIFYSKPPQSVTELASRYGVSSATEAGVPKDKALLDTINKYSDVKFKTLDEAEQDLATVERALQNRAAAKGTEAGKAGEVANQAGLELKSLDWTPSRERVSSEAGGALSTSPTESVPASQPPLPQTSTTASLPEATTRATVPSTTAGPATTRVGDIDQSSKRIVLQAANDVQENLTRANEALPKLQALGDELASIIDGTEFVGARVKEMPRLTDKLRTRAANTISDYLGSRLTFDDMGDAEKIINALKEKGLVVTADDFITNPRNGGYRAIHLQIDMGNGFTAEMQLVPDEIAKVQQLAHKEYDVFRDSTASLEAVEAAKAKTETIFNAAWEKWEAKSKKIQAGEGIAATPKNPEVEIHPPYVDGSTPIPGQMWKENADGIVAALNKVESHMLDNYGMKAVEKMDGSTLKALKGLMKDSSGRITEGIAVADKIGKEWRDFALLPYGETRNFDLALSYAFPYQFWYSRSYNNWMKRIATDPQVLANYARIKEAMSRINKDSPEWWRYNVEIPSHFLGLPNEHPMSFNLEANIWPLYGLTGTDFNDPQKRQNWITSTIDDMGKFGPSPWSPIQWGIAAYYRAKGEDELAQAWAGRLIPQTATIKAVSSYFGQPVELDPMVQLFSGKGIMDFGAMDKYERNRVGRALTSMVQSGELTNEQAVEIARTQEGPAWDEAVKRATQLRAPGQISSYFLGVGMKARTDEDRVTDEFYQEYYRLNNLNEADLISPQDYQKSWDALRDKYPFMDALLLSRKAGPDRDRAYAYNVLGRIPPGQAGDLYKLVGVDAKTAQKFYDSKGNIEGWSQSDKDKFMASMVDLGAMLAIPDYATKTDWNAARNEYKKITEGMKQNFGSDIQDKIDTYFGMDDTDQRKNFLKANPLVQQALDWQNAQVVDNEKVYEYYGGISSLEKFYKGKVYDQLETKFGADIGDKWDQYYNMQLADPPGAKKYYRQHPELKAYTKEKTKLMEEALRNIVAFGSRLPEAPKPELTGNTPESVGQQNIQEYANQPASLPFQYWQSQMPEVSAILADYWTNGSKLPYAVDKNLDYQAQQYGYNSGDELKQAILISLERQTP